MFPLSERQLSALERTRVARGLGRALAYLHLVARPAVVHRSVRPSSVLCDDANDVKLAAFDGAQPVGVDSVPWSAGSEAPRWSAPELLEQRSYDARVDVYSVRHCVSLSLLLFFFLFAQLTRSLIVAAVQFGIVLWQLLAQKVPYGDVGDSARAVRARVLSGVRPDASLIMQKAPALAGLVVRCWSAHAEQRPTMVEGLLLPSCYSNDSIIFALVFLFFFFFLCV